MCEETNYVKVVITYTIVTATILCTVFMYSKFPHLCLVKPGGISMPEEHTVLGLKASSEETCCTSG